MPFGSFSKMLEDAKSKGQSLFAKVKDRATFERVVMACYLIGGADGTFDEDEKSATAKLIDNKFPEFNLDEILAVIKTCDDKMTFSATMGEMDLLKEIGKATGDDAELIIQAACFIGEADGSFDQDEKNMVRKMIDKMGKNPQEFGL